LRRYYFRVDGGNIHSVATGHITRCLKLADYISEKEPAEIFFLMRRHKEGINLVKNKYIVIGLEVDRNIESEIEYIKDTIRQDSYFICDIRNINTVYVKEIKQKCHTFVLFDDLKIKDVGSDILINPTPFCYSDYDECDYPDTKLLLGERFFFVSQYLTSKSYQRNFDKDNLMIMASFGGADPCNISEYFVEHVVPQLSSHNVSIVLGPAYEKKAELLKKYGSISQLTFYTDLSSLDDLLLQNDIAFVCGGDTCIEACASGIATFIISSIDYEKKIGKMLEERKMVLFVTDIEDIRAHRHNDGYLDILSKDTYLLRNLSANGMSLVDGRGLERTYKILRNRE
jgi:spore coat polysaccharide biosynthesis predicted glycosyltransferase SpsG